MKEVARIMYMSVPRMQGSAVDQLLRLRRRAAIRNRADGVHTALYVGTGRILQWLEGPRTGVLAAMARAVRDTRHVSHRLVHDTRGPRTLRDSWVLRASPLVVPGAAWADRVGRNVDARSEPLQLWERITAPWKGFEPAMPADSVSKTKIIRVLLLGASDHNFELVRRVAAWQEAPVVYERYGISAPDAPDTGGCYVDVGGEPGRLPRMRLHALARNSLRHHLLAALHWDIVLTVQPPGGATDGSSLEESARRISKMLSIA